MKNLAELTAAVQAANRGPFEVTVPGVECAFWLRQITGAERDRYEIATSKNPADFRTRLLLVALSDGDGRRLCLDADLEMIKAWPGHVVDALFQAACEHNRIGGNQEGARAGND